MGGTAAVFAATSAANSAAAQVAAHRAMVERCKIEIAGYEPKTATVAQMQSYAQCVGAVYPAMPAGPELLLAKAAVALALIGVPLGVWWARSKLDGSIAGMITGALVGEVFVPAIPAFILAMAYGVWWIFQ